MTPSGGGTRWLLNAAATVCFVALGVAIGAALWRRPAPRSAEEHQGTRTGPPAAAASTMPAPADGVVTLTPEMMTRAGIKTVAATKGTATLRLHVPGVVQPNGYKTVAVTSLVAGRITQVRAELGQRVAAGEVLASVYSPELADAQTAYIAARADQVAHGQRQGRAQRLFATGAVSRQELDMLDADRARMDAAVANAKARLALLGMSDDRIQRLTNALDVITTFDIAAPIAGVVTKRGANMGLNIEPSTPLFTVVDLATVWVVADLYERDFAKVHVKSPATITTASYPGLALKGQVNYIDPQVQEETRTAKLRVEVPNPGDQLRFGMYVEVGLGEESTAPVVFIPKAAVQVVGSSSVVYLATERHGTFIEKKVEIGDASGDRVNVLAGVQPGDLVVTDGAFFLRAEHERAAPAPTRSDK